MGKRVVYCKSSTITEAWALVLGLASEPNRDEVDALPAAAHKRLGSTARDPAFIVVQGLKDRSKTPPHWNQQRSWNGRRQLARIGHQYLSVHYLANEESRYSRYEECLQHPLEAWLDSYGEVLTREPAAYPLSSVVFGYVNKFDFPIENFDLSRFFRISVGIGADTPASELVGLDAGFRYINGMAEVTMRVAVDTVLADEGRISVLTTVTAERDAEKYSFKDKEAILATVLQAKESAKDGFFSVATDETHTLMGAQYASE